MIRSILSSVLMPQLLLPPRGMFIPTRMIFNPQLPPAVLVTWIQLRCLAWDGWVTPPLNMHELTQITGKSQATLCKHISLLRESTTLRLRCTGQGKIIVSFHEEFTDKAEHKPGSPNFPDSKILNSINSKSLDPRSYFPPRILGYISFQEGT